MSNRLKYREIITTDKKINKANLALLKTNTTSKDPEMTKESKLLLKLMKSHGPRQSIIESYNNWINRNIKLQLCDRLFETPDGHIKLSNIEIKPKTMIKDNKNVIITPRYCRESNETYEAEIFATAEFVAKIKPEINKKNLTQKEKTEIKKIIKQENVLLGSIPIMLRSDLCMLTNLSDGQRMNLGECTNDYGGYFILEGNNEKTIISQEKLRTGEFIVWTDNTGKIECSVTCATDSATTNVKIIPGTKWDTLKVEIHYMGKDKHIPLYVAFAFLGYNEYNATDLISHFIPDKMKQATIMYLQSSIFRSRSIGPNIVGYVINKKSKNKSNLKSYSDNAEDIIKIIRNNLFSNIKTLNGKAKALAFMTSQVILSIMGEISLNNRDSYSLKKIYTPAKLMETKLNAIWTDIIMKITSQLNSSTYTEKTNTEKDMDKYLKGFLGLMSGFTTNINNEFTKSFLQFWRMKNGQIVESVTDMLKRDTPAALISQITRLATQSSTMTKNSMVREVDQSQLNGVCIAETPEGGTCLTKNAMVLMEDGTMKSIAEIKLGDIVQFYNITHKVFSTTKIVKLYSFYTNTVDSRIYKIIVNNQEIEATNDHPFLTQYGWVAVADLKINFHLLAIKNGNNVEFSKIDCIIQIEDDIVYDITVDAKSHNFIANGFVTHNCGLVKNLALSTSISLDHDINSFFILMSGELLGYENALPEIKSSFIPFNWQENVYMLYSEDPRYKNIPNIEDYTEIKFDEEKFENESDEDYKIRIFLMREEEINKKFKYPIFINGILCGWCKDSSIEKHLQRCRRFNLIPYDCCIFYNNQRECLEIDTTGGRIIRPVLVVENNKLVIDELNAWDYEITTLMKNGCIAYIDLKEQEKMMIASTTDKVRNMDDKISFLKSKIISLENDEKNKKSKGSKPDENIELTNLKMDLDEILNYPYEFCEIHPIVELGNLAGMIPMANKTQGPRITYQASMGKQALNQYHTMEYDRMDTQYKVMSTPTVPIFQSEICIPNGLTIMPSGDTIIKAIFAHPDNPEDGIVFNEDSLRSGKLAINRYITHKLLFNKKTDKKNLEIRTKPTLTSINANTRYHSIQPNGLPTLDTYLKQGDCVIGRERIIKEGKNIAKVTNASLYIGIGEEGYVDRISVNKVAKGILVKVKLRQSRSQIEGDKLASRYSQKGTVAKIVPASEMIRVASGPNKGMSPDLQVNPHAIPSRMPMAEQIEMLTSKAAAYHGYRVDSTTFNDLDNNDNVKYAVKTLDDTWNKYYKNNPEEPTHDIYGQQYGSRFKYGYEDVEIPIRVMPEDKIGQGPKYLVTNGKYRPCRNPIFMGPCYTQVLKHHVLDKFQMRSIGLLDATTHQPVSGRSRAGGQRLGEMERDALISHAATELLLERLMIVSDLFEATICVKCGHFAIANYSKGEIRCNLCDTINTKGGQFGQIRFPCVFKYLIHLLQLAMIDVMFEIEPINQFGIDNDLQENLYIS